MIELTFLGTRGGIKVRSRAHRRHSSLLVVSGGHRTMIDCGSDWLGRLDKIAPDAIIVTHAHPDHAFGLADGAPCPVYAPERTWRNLPDYPIADRRTVPLRKPISLGRLSWEAFPVVHSVRAPAVGYRVSGRTIDFFYVPDVVAIPERSEALQGALLYIGDGATIRRSMVRRHGEALFGHCSIRTQLGWCAKEGVDRAVFTHCGTEIVSGDGRRLGPEVGRLGRDVGVNARIARDGLTLRLGS
jgi:phosphoribosyl 1,2-cyclic phosphodiesterase